MRSRIVDGDPSGAEQDGVVLLRGLLEDDTEFVCSASLVAPNLLLTAQHCVSYISEGMFSCNARGELTDNPNGGGRLGLSLPPEQIEVYAGPTPRRALARGAQIISTHSSNICQNDIAFVVLDTSLELPLLPLRVGHPARVGELGALVGYGMDAGERGIDYRVQQREQKRGLEIRGVGPDTVAEGVTTVPPRTLLLEGPSGCVGDSGGPLLADSTGAIVGIYSLQLGQDCAASRVAHQLVHLPPFELLIEDAFTAVGAAPLLEEPAPDEPSAGGHGAGGEMTGPTPNDAGMPVTGGPEPVGRSSSCALEPSPSHGLGSLAPLLLLVLRRRRR